MLQNLKDSFSRIYLSLVEIEPNTVVGYFSLFRSKYITFAQVGLSMTVGLGSPQQLVDQVS
jgi:hypothetical protein